MSQCSFSCWPQLSLQTYFTTLVADSMNDLNLSVLWDHPDFPVDYTYCSIANDTASFSTIDHFAISPMLEKVVIEAGVVHSGGKHFQPWTDLYQNWSWEDQFRVHIGDGKENYHWSVDCVR